MDQFDSEQYNKNYTFNFTKEMAYRHFKKYGQFNGYTDQKDLKKIKITIITPCSRPQNLLRIKDSLDFNHICEWIIVHDTNTPLKYFEDTTISEYNFKGFGRSGNPQRNYGLTRVQNKESYIYFLDDDNIIHPDLYKLTLVPNRIYTFDQLDQLGKIRLTGYKIKVGQIDTAMFLVWFPLVKDIQWDIDKYDADGYYITECYKFKDKFIYINKSLSYYNYLSINDTNSTTV